MELALRTERSTVIGGDATQHRYEGDDGNNRTYC